jgi:hypothetical protein
MLLFTKWIITVVRRRRNKTKNKNIYFPLLLKNLRSFNRVKLDVRNRFPVITADVDGWLRSRSRKQLSSACLSSFILVFNWSRSLLDFIPIAWKNINKTK